ncbi:MAG: hypothetical protein AB8A40_04310 [Prochlorococcus sp.]|jgi:hypothetical protein|nr:hypothetical protein [Prochlorococcaceae cyanobacterium ETNP18_MAG_14]MDP6309852.1 hypothetical protein [Prochlorococcaceae cyanobacterium ETNP14_MAG_4]HJM80620.1 hypothetical protein [Prochlorococcaceae cyanobacterium Fu_MAG_72]|tara:strand:+ start:4359 stop:5864 length:1506 start_codon:yes stop_codon:yes gene_type:complete
MVRPRWQGLKPSTSGKFWRRWDQALALIAAANLSWIIFDISYVPLRNFWIHRNLYPLPSSSLMVPLPWLPDITPLYDPVKGIKPHQETQLYIQHFNQLDQAAAREGINSPAVHQLRLEQVMLTSQMIDENPFVGSGNVGTLEKLKSRLRARAQMDSAKQATAHLLGNKYLNNLDWQQERQFWTQKILPLVATNYWRATDENGQPVDHAWRLDIPFQLLFLLDIFLRALRLKHRFPAIAWRDALLRRWIDLPLLLPFWRPLRLVPVTERLSSANLIELEPLRAVVSRWVVALLALELFEVLTLRIVDAMQGVIRSPLLPQRIRSLRSHQSVEKNEASELAELLQLWLPLLLKEVGPSMRPQFLALFSHALQRSMDGAMVPTPLKGLAVIEKAESEFSRQLAAGMIDVILELSRNAGDQLGRKDMVLEQLGVDTIDRFWEELARNLEQGPVLERSQELIVALLEDFKRSSFRQLKEQVVVNELITELDGLNFNSTTPQPRPPA